MFVSPTPVPALLLADCFALIVDRLCRAQAVRMARNPALVPLLLLVWGRLRRMAARFALLAARAASGTLPPRRIAAPPRQRPARPRQRLPEGFAWLVRLVPEAAGYGGQVQHWLADPDLAALLAAAPQAGRILRPLCRMLGLRLTVSLLPPPRAKPAVPDLPAAAAGTPLHLPPARPPPPLPGQASVRVPRVFVPG